MENLVAAAIGALLLAAVAAGPAAARTDASDWSDDRGAATAQRLIEKCLKTTPAAWEANLGCIDAAFEPCTLENGGTMSQYDLNACRGFSYRAWRERYDRMRIRFEGLLQTWTQPSADGWKRSMAARFGAQEEAWRRWLVTDCEMWELGSAGGSIHGYAVATCEERHIALRTITLAPFLEWLESR